MKIHAVEKAEQALRGSFVALLLRSLQVRKQKYQQLSEGKQDVVKESIQTSIERRNEGSN
jgi:hypothetical protein